MLSAACSGMFLFGIVLAILGALFGLPQMRARIAIDLAQQGDILLLLFLGVFASTILVGPIIDNFGNKLVLAVSAAIVVAGLLGLSVAHSFLTAIVWAFVLGFGGGGLNTSSNALVADVFEEERGAMLNLVGMFYGVGALFIPLLAASITTALTIPELLLIAAALAALCMVAYLLLPFPAAHRQAGFSIFASLEAVKIPGVMLFAFVLFCESGNESAIGGWASTYVGSAGLSATVATSILAAYWAALMVGRLLSMKLLKRMRKETLVLASAAGSVIGAAILLAVPSLATLAIGAVIIGISFAPIYPTTLAAAADRYQRNAGTIFGFLFAVGLIGGMLFPWAVGHIAESWSVRAGMLLPLLGAIAISVAAGAHPPPATKAPR